MPLPSFPDTPHMPFNEKKQQPTTFHISDQLFLLKKIERHILQLSGLKDTVSNNHAQYYIQVFEALSGKYMIINWPQCGVLKQRLFHVTRRKFVTAPESS